jgi:hypothetical protein
VFSLRDHRSNTVPQASRGASGASMFATLLGACSTSLLTNHSRPCTSRLSTGLRHSRRPTWNSALSFGHENQLERCPQVSVRRIFCYSRGELVFFLAWRERSFSFLRIFRNDTGILVLSRLHTFRPVSDLLLFWVHQKMIWRKSAMSRRCKPGWDLSPRPVLAGS